MHQLKKKSVPNQKRVPWLTEGYKGGDQEVQENGAYFETRQGKFR